MNWIPRALELLAALCFLFAAFFPEFIKLALIPLGLFLWVLSGVVGWVLPKGK